MKKNIFLSAICAACLFSANLLAQNNNSLQTDTLAKHYARLLASTDNVDRSLLEKEMYDLLKSSHETDWSTAHRYFFQLKKGATSDSLLSATRIKFPDGMLVRADEVKKVYDTKPAKEKEAALLSWMKKFQPEKFGPDRIVYDYARNSVGTEYAKENNIPKAIEYASNIETQPWKGEGFASVASILMKNKQFDEAAPLVLKAILNSEEFMTTRKNEMGAGFAAQGYPGYCNMYAEILLIQKKYDEALTYVKKAHDERKDVTGYVNANYAKILEALDKNREAFDIIAEAVRAGQANDAMKEDMKNLYAKINPSGSFDAYMEKANKDFIEKMLADLPKQMINQPAPTFTLKDVEGKTVSLAELKGKTVIVDFWATWCGPCKASFPAMQMAVNKYKNDPGVKFLFIHTWERDDKTPTENARKYVEEMKYNFQVLMDMKDQKTGANKVIESYKVTGIPTKFVIDKNGNIRFKLTGFSGGNDAAVEEVSAMIELSRK